MSIDFLIERFKTNAQQPAIIWKDTTLTYAELLSKYFDAIRFIEENAILKGEVVSLNGDFTPNTIALLLALIQNENIIVPFNFPVKEAETVFPTLSRLKNTLDGSIFKALINESRVSLLAW